MRFGCDSLERSEITVPHGANSYSPVRESDRAREENGFLTRDGDDPINAMTVDVEDYFQVSAFDPYIKRSEWDGFTTRVEENVEKILMTFESAGIVGTFSRWVGLRKNIRI